MCREPLLPIVFYRLPVSVNAKQLLFFFFFPSIFCIFSSAFFFVLFLSKFIFLRLLILF